MQERKNKFLLITLLLLVTTTAVFLLIQSRSKTTLVDKNLFKVTDLKTIDRIELQSATNTVLLTFNGTRWLVNNNYAADRDMIDVLFATLLQAEPKRPIAENLKDSLVDVLKTSGVNVQLFEKGETNKAFYVSGNAAKTQAWFMDEQENVYVMNIPGYRVYVSGIFEQVESAWRDKYVFAFNWANFKSLKTEFTTVTKDDFEVEMTDGFFSVKNLPTDTTKLNDFLDAVSLLTVDEYVEADTLTGMTPALAVTVTDIANRNYILSIFDFSIGGKTACLLRDGQAAWIDNRKLARLIRNRDFFRSKP